jgi:outer membrane immunogenic protein
MNKFCVGTLALVATAGSAFAADLPVAPVYKAPGPPIEYSGWNWGGCYLGVEGGGGIGRSQHIATANPVPTLAGLPITSSFQVSGGLFGGTVGCNYQMGNAVFGIEDDMSWANLRGSANQLAPFAPARTSSTNENWLDTLRGRAGLEWDRLFVYGTGGAAFANEGISVCAPGGLCASQSQNRVGWTAGLGAEWAAWTSGSTILTFKVEYLHVDLGRTGFLNPPVTVGPATFETRDVRLTDEIVRAGLNLKFNWWR